MMNKILSVCAAVALVASIAMIGCSKDDGKGTGSPTAAKKAPTTQKVETTPAPTVAATTSAPTTAGSK